MINRTSTTGHFLVHWVLANVLSWPGSLFLCMLLWWPFSIFLNFLELYTATNFLIPLIETSFRVIVFGIVFAYVLSGFQKSLAQEELNWHLETWLKYSSFGGLIGGLVILSLLYMPLSSSTVWFLTMPIFMSILSFFQWLKLRQMVYEAWLWILANFSAASVFSGLLFMNSPDTLIHNDPLLHFSLWILAILAQSLITGIVLLYLYDRLIPDDAELAPVYLEVRDE